MKKLISILIIVLLLIGACIVEQIIVYDYITSTEEELLQVEKNYSEITPENKEELLILLSKIKEDWIKKDNVLCFFVNHNDISDLGSELVRAENAIKENDTSVFRESITLSIFYINGYKQFMFINLRSVF